MYTSACRNLFLKYMLNILLQQEIFIKDYLLTNFFTPCQLFVEMDAEDKWKELVNHLSPPSVLNPETKTYCKELVADLESLKYPVEKCLGSWYRIKFRYYFKATIYNKMLDLLQSQNDILYTFQTIVNYLGKNVLQYLINFYTVEEIDESFSKNLIYQDILVFILENPELTQMFRDCSVNLYKIGFDAFEKNQNCEDLSENERVQNEEKFKNFNKIHQYMCCLHLFEDIAYDAVLHSLNSQINDFIIENFSGQSFETSIIYPTFLWLETSVLPYVHILTEPFVTPPNLDQWKHRLTYLCYKTISDVRTADLFEIMVDYPASHPAVSDLKKCLDHIKCHNQLTLSLQLAFKERLLNPGVNTDDIITQYSSAIKVLKFLDPSGVTLHKVCLSLRKYIKERDDTIKCILNSLINKERKELAREISEGSRSLFAGDDDSDLENDDWTKWNPPSKEISIETKGFSKPHDTIVTLCSIFGSTDVFVSEYRNLVADKLLSTSNYGLQYEIQNLALLKTAFGKDLNQCRIMIQDVLNSQKTHSLIMKRVKDKPSFDINVIMISHVFWPNLRSDDIEVYKPLQEFLEDEYQKHFSDIKQSRTLEWKYNLGFVEIDLEFEYKTLSFTVSPIQATIISLFEETEKHHADSISDLVGLSLSQTRKKLAFWVTNGILHESSKDIYELRGDASAGKSTKVVEDIDSAMVRIEEIREEELEGYTNFVMGLLNSTGQVTIERVQNLLSMLLSDSIAGQLTADEVKTFLDKKVKQKLLVYSGGVYKKAK